MSHVARLMPHVECEHIVLLFLMYELVILWQVIGYAGESGAALYMGK